MRISKEDNDADYVCSGRLELLYGLLQGMKFLIEARTDCSDCGWGRLFWVFLAGPWPQGEMCVDV